MFENKRRILNSPLVTVHGLGPLTVTFKKKGLDNYQMLEYTNCNEK